MSALTDTVWSRPLADAMRTGQSVVSEIRVSDGDSTHPWVALYRGAASSWCYARMTPWTHGIGIVEGPRAAIESAAQGDGEWRRLFVPEVVG